MELKPNGENAFYLVISFSSCIGKANPKKTANKYTNKRKTLTKQESVFDKHKCPRKHKIIKQMFSVFAYFSRFQRCSNKNKLVKTIVHIMSSYEVEMILTMLVTMTLN